MKLRVPPCTAVVTKASGPENARASHLPLQCILLFVSLQGEPGNRGRPGPMGEQVSERLCVNTAHSLSTTSVLWSPLLCLLPPTPCVTSGQLQSRLTVGDLQPCVTKPLIAVTTAIAYGLPATMVLVLLPKAARTWTHGSHCYPSGCQQLEKRNRMPGLLVQASLNYKE